MPRIKLIIDNTTRYSTQDLRRFLLAGMRAKGVGHREVYIVYGKGSACNGWGTLGVEGNPHRHGITLQLSLPGPAFIRALRTAGKIPINYLQLAQVFEHEIDHTLGLRHSDMKDWWLLQPTWHEGLTIAHAPEKQAKTSEQCVAARSATITQRAEHARAMLKKAETRFKRAKTIRDKWAKKARYYDRKNSL